MGWGYVEPHVGGHAIFLDPTTIPVETTEHIHSIEIAARHRNLELCSCLKILYRNAIAPSPLPLKVVSRFFLGRALLLIVMEWPRTCDEEIVAREGDGCIRFMRSSLSVREKRRLAPWESSPECVFHAEDRVVRSA